MPVYRKAPQKEALAFSFNDISMLLDQMSDKEKKYSLRARSSIRTVNGMQQTVYLLFLRNGSESVFEKWDNWWNAQAQRALAKQLVCKALAERPDGASPGQARMKMAHRERALLSIRKIDRMAPEKIRAIFSDCIAAQKEIDVFNNKLLAVSLEDRLKFDAFHQDFGDILSKEKPCEMSFRLIQKNPVKKNPINEMLAEANSHYLQVMLQAFLQFADAVAGNRPLSEIDLALVLEFSKKRKKSRAASEQSDSANPAISDGEAMAACWKAIDTLLELCDKYQCPALPAAHDAVGGKRLAVVPVQCQPPSPKSSSRPQPPALPALPASLFQSLWACSAGRSAGAVYAASTLMAPLAKKIVSRATPADAALAAARQSVRTSPVEPTPIRPAQSPQDICCDWQSELDLADIDSEAVILVRSGGGLFSMSSACNRWLEDLSHHQHVEEAHFSKVHYQRQTVLLARAQHLTVNGNVGGEESRRLSQIYEAAVATAVSEGKPICLTDLFDYDPRTADQCVEAMLAPIRRCYQEGKQPAVHIRVSSPSLRENVVAALKALLLVPLPQRPAVEVIDRLTEADMQLPGLIMVSGDATDPLSRRLARRHAKNTKSAAPGAAVSRVGPRRMLGSQTKTHLYFFARPCPLKNGLPDGALIAGEYAALFDEARRHQCELVTFEVLSETRGQEKRLVAALSAAIIAARALAPKLKVRIVTRNKAIRDGVQACF
jgi:hypothetical protein